MRPLISWLTAIDDGFLRYMARYPELELPPMAWHHNLTKEQEASVDHLRHRIAVLEDAGLIETSDHKSGYYGITELGVRYTEGKVSNKRMERLNPRADDEEGDDGDDEDCDDDGDQGADVDADGGTDTAEG